jgi:predicted MFS family arabinose efflux permease
MTVKPMRQDAEVRRLVLVVSAVVFVDTMFYAVIAPLLPSLAHELHLSKLSAGLMTASYAIGTLAGSLPGGILAVRAGPKFTVCVGLALLACSTVAFALLHNAALLDVARFVEGVGGACSWAGGLAWIVAETPADRRGAMIGRALGAAIGGALFGPVIGTVATATGRPAAFGVLVLAALLLILAAARLPSHHVESRQGIGNLTRALRGPGVAIGMWLVALPALASGLLNVLGPLRLHRLGAAAAAIGATYLVAAAIEAVISPAVGSLSDRRGRVAPLRFGLVAATATLLCFTLPGAPLPLALVIVSVCAALGVFWAPAMAMLSDAAEADGLDQGLAAALMNLAWAGGQIVGSGGGGAAAKIAGDGLPIAVTAALCAVTLLALGRASGAPRRKIALSARATSTPTAAPDRPRSRA